MRQTAANIKINLSLVATAWAALATSALAQEDGGDPVPDEDIEEIVVIGGEREGDKFDIDALYEDEMRERLMRDLESIKEEQDKGRWGASSAGIVETPSRMQWGYNPEAQSKMRRETDLMGVQYETVKPASLVRWEF